MTEGARRTSAPVIAAVVAGVIAVALAVIFFVVVLPEDDGSASGSGARASGGLTTRERTAMLAARTEAVNLQTYARTTFDRDWARAVNGATGALRKDLLARKAATKKVLDDRKIDLAAVAQAYALVGPADSGDGLQVIVTMNGYAVRGTNRTLTATQRLLLTMVEQQGKWYAADVSQRGLA
jgi:hypothetical protein